MPLLLRGLDLSNDDLRADVIDTFYEITQESPVENILSEYASTLVLSMLKISRMENGKYATVSI